MRGLGKAGRGGEIGDGHLREPVEGKQVKILKSMYRLDKLFRKLEEAREKGNM